MVNLVNTAALGAVEFAINKALSLDIASQNRLRKMANTSFHLQCQNPDINVFAIIADNGELSLQSEYSATASCAIQGEFKDVVSLLTANDKTNALINSDLKINGDSKHLVELQNILADLDLDWEAQLAKITGDVVAHQIGKGVRGFLKWRKYAHERLSANFTEYMQEEGKLTPPKLELEDFFQDIRDLSLKVERLQARAEKIKKSSNKTEGKA